MKRVTTSSRSGRSSSAATGDASTSSGGAAVGRCKCRCPGGLLLLRRGRPLSTTTSRRAAEGASDRFGGDGGERTPGVEGSILPGSLLDGTSLPENFSIIESSETMKDFGRMELKDMRDNIVARRNTIFLLMEEVRRLRIQLRVKEGDGDGAKSAAALSEDAGAREREDEELYSSAIPFLPPVSTDTLKYYYWVYGLGVASLVIFGGLVAPAIEVRLGIGGLSYLELIESVGLPRQLAQVDPIVASFVGGAVGVLSALLVVEVNNVTEREKDKCFYCEGSGYLSCGQCGGTGLVDGEACPMCSKTGKVMCTTCLCTGRLMATEHDPRIDPFV